MLNLSFFLGFCFYNKENQGKRKMFLTTATKPISVTPQLWLWPFLYFPNIYPCPSSLTTR